MMKKFEVVISMDLEHKSVIEAESVETAEYEVRGAIHQMSTEEFNEFLGSSRLRYGKYFVDIVTPLEKVNSALNEFDPFVVLPEAKDEYFPLAIRISEKIKRNMSKEELADIIADEFAYSFGEEEGFTRDNCMYPAEIVYDYLVKTR